MSLFGTFQGISSIPRSPACTTGSASICRSRSRTGSAFAAQAAPTPDDFQTNDDFLGAGGHAAMSPNKGGARNQGRTLEMGGSDKKDQESMQYYTVYRTVTRTVEAHCAQSRAPNSRCLF